MAPSLSRITSPSQALDIHLRKFREADEEGRYIARQSGLSEYGNKVAIEIDKAKNTMRWFSFASTYSRPAAVMNEDGTLQPLDVDDTSVEYLQDGRTQQEREVVLGEHTFNEDVLQTGLVMSSMEWQMLNEARTHYITTEMMNLVTEAADLVEPEPLFDTDLPCDAGFLVFETPLMMDDLHPETGDPLGERIMPVRAIGWRRTKIGSRDMRGAVDGIVLINYTTNDDFATHYIPRIDEIVGASEPTILGTDEWMWPIEYHPWAFGVDWSAVDYLGEQAQGKIVSPVAYNRRWMMTLFRIMWQRIIAPERWHPSRQVRRAFEREPQRRKPMQVDGEAYTVLMLRRFIEPRTPEQHDKPDDWADWPYPYRIPVDKHWRRQHYASLGPARNEDGSFNIDSHRRIFIHEHTRGPDHLPILERHGVTAVVR